MRINNIHTKQSFTSLLISSSVTNLKPANREKINVVRDMASYMPDMDFVIESNNAGDMQITIQRAHPLDMLIACGLVQFNSKEHHFIELVKAAQQTHNIKKLFLKRLTTKKPLLLLKIWWIYLMKQ